MLTRPCRSGLGRGQDHKTEAKANSHEAEAKIALFFSAKFYILTIVFFQKKQMFGPFSTGLQKFRLKTGFNVGTLLVNTPEMTSYTPLDAGYCFCVYTLN